MKGRVKARPFSRMDGTLRRKETTCQPRGKDRLIVPCQSKSEKFKMARTIDVSGLKAGSIRSLHGASNRLRSIGVAASGHELVFQRWVYSMTAVEVHSIWERYVERRLVAALNHDATHFINKEEIKGVTRVSAGFAFYIVRSGQKYFDVRSSGELLDKSDKLLGQANNPFRAITLVNRKYLDAMSAIRNLVVHGSPAAITAYNRELNGKYAIRYPPQPGEFLCAIEHRLGAPGRGGTRLAGIIAIVADAINQT
jgi:hypothetical protein